MNKVKHHSMLLIEKKSIFLAAILDYAIFLVTFREPDNLKSYQYFFIIFSYS